MTPIVLPAGPNSTLVAADPWASSAPKTRMYTGHRPAACYLRLARPDGTIYTCTCVQYLLQHQTRGEAVARTHPIH